MANESTPVRKLLGELPADLREEAIEVLAENGAVRIERIVSTGQVSPAGFWYDQEREEWVALLQGEATLRLEAPDEVVELRAGEAIAIAAHRRHRVERTSVEPPAIWLAVHYSPSDADQCPGRTRH